MKLLYAEDERALSQMISILLDNALKYTPRGGVVSLTLRRRGGETEIVEENTCLASPKEDPERLFERFYRGDNARTQSDPTAGFGIGLSAARAIAETFGSRLTAAYGGAGTIIFTARF